MARIGHQPGLAAKLRMARIGHQPGLAAKLRMARIGHQPGLAAKLRMARIGHQPGLAAKLRMARIGHQPGLAAKLRMARIGRQPGLAAKLRPDVSPGWRQSRNPGSHDPTHQEALKGALEVRRRQLLHVGTRCLSSPSYSGTKRFRPFTGKINFFAPRFQSLTPNLPGCIPARVLT